MIEPILTALGLTKGATVGAFFGALISLRFLGALNIWQGACALFSGTIAASFIAPLLLEVTSLSSRTEGALAFLIGVFGLVFGASFVRAMPDIVTAVRERISGGAR